MDRYIKKKFPFLIHYIILLIIIFFFVILLIFNNNKKRSLDLNKINFKLIATTHTSLPWEFKPVNSSVDIKIGEVTNI